MPFAPSVPGSSATSGAIPGLTNGNPGSAGGSIGNQALVKTLYDFDPFAIMQELHQRNESLTHDFAMWLKGAGMSRGVDAPLTGHYERTWNVNLVKIGAVTTPAGGAGLQAVLTLHADSMYNASLTASGSAVQESQVELQDIIQFDSGVKAIVIAKNTAVSPHTITVKPLKAAATLVSNVTANSSYAIVTNAWGEGTGLKKGSTPRIIKYTNTFQIVKEGTGATGTSMTDKLFVNWAPGVENGSIYGALNMEMVDRFERSKGNAILFGETIDNITQFNSQLDIDIAVVGNEGAIEWVKSYGHLPSYAGTYDLADFNVLADILTSERIGTKVMVNMMGYGLYMSIEDVLFNYTGTTNILPSLTKTIAGGVGGDKNLDLFGDNFDFFIGYKAVQKGNFQFLFKMLSEFNDATGMGAGAYTLTNGYRDSQLVLPFGQRKDHKTGRAGFMAGYEYKQLAGYSREVQFGQYGGVGTSGAFSAFGPTFVANEYDSVRAGMLAEVCFHGACPNQAVWQTKGS